MVPRDTSDPSGLPGRSLAVLAASNQASWFAATAVALGGRESNSALGRRTDVPAAVGDADLAGEAGISIVTLEALDDSSLDIEGSVDAILEEARSDPAIAQVWWWAVDSGSDRSLGQVLVDRGFSWDWQPWWMHLEFAAAGPQYVPRIDGVEIAEVRDDVDWDLPDLPYFDRRLGRSYGALVSDSSDGTSTAVFVASAADGRVIGTIAIHAQRETDGRRVAGIYACEVDAEHRRRGIGLALTATAVEWAADHACTDVTLNATPMGALLYPSAGFRRVGEGQTWSIRRAGIEGRPRR